MHAQLPQAPPHRSPVYGRPQAPAELEDLEALGRTGAGGLGWNPPGVPAAAATACRRLLTSPPLLCGRLCVRQLDPPCLPTPCLPQWDMYRLKRDPRFQEKFPEHAVEEEAQQESTLTVRLKSGEQEQ